MRIVHADFLVEPLDHLMVILHTRRPPPDAEWSQLAASADPDRAPLPMLVLTDGGNPTSKQRALVHPVVSKEKPMTAVISEATTIRFVVSTLTLLNENVRTFAPSGVDEALAWLAVPFATASEARRTLRRLARDPGGERFEPLQRAIPGLKRA
jgi:hypothetical protein